MKKFICMFLSLIMMLSLVACSNQKGESVNDMLIQNDIEENKEDEINNESSEEILSGDVSKEETKKYFSEIKLEKFEKNQKIILDENPTTGYTWSYKIEDESIVKIEDENFVAASGDLVGAGGYHHYTISGLTQGKTDIIFNRMRVWDGEDSTIETVRFFISVDEENKIAILEERNK